MGGRHAAGRDGRRRRAVAGDDAWWRELGAVGPTAVPAAWPLGPTSSPPAAAAGRAPAASDGGTAAAPPGAPVVPGWRLLRPLGRGGTGEVWRADPVDPVAGADGSPAVLKVLRTSVAGDAAARRRLEGEAALLTALDHPHLVRLRHLTATDEPRPRPVLVLDHAAGGSLGALVAARGPLGPAEVTTLLVPLAGLLADLHDGGLVHGDVSPGNVLLAEDGRPLLADLGTAALEGCGARTAGRPGDDDVEVTAGYADARRAGGGPATPAGDVHALGACAWHALTGRVPGPPTERAPLVVLRPDLPRALVDLVEDCLEEDEGRRPAPRELASRAFDAAAPEPVRLVRVDPDAPADEVVTHRVRQAARAVPPPEVGARRRRRVLRGVGGRRSLLAAGVVVVLALLLALLVPVLVAPGPVPPPEAVPAAAPTAAPSATTVPPSAAPPAGATPSPAAAAVPPATAVAALADLRARALAVADRALLADVVVPGSPAEERDTALVEDLERRGARLDGLDVTVLVASAAEADDDGRVPVDVRTTTSAHRLVAEDGTVLAEVPAAADVAARLLLERWGASWRVAEVTAAPAPS
ncbi:serine/threonine-protein kinase [Pseudokineococcus lusitanus]|uniref:serine/threonine-protein kinase n=1 Tax=Pseudokineococcus lusitanus TaxID=763993 RepID=UPI00131A45FC|nr:serine/threonine-protein kinase [Pseudokineococcus lusitanus]